MSYKNTLFSIGLSAAALISTLALSHGQAQAATTGTTTYKDGATTVWNAPSFGTAARYLGQGQQVTITGSKTVDGTTWYQIGQNEWVPSIYMQSSDDTAAATTNTAAAVGSVKVNYTAGSTTVWTGVDSGQAAGYLAPGATASYTETQQANGLTWYHISNGWVPSKFVSVVGTDAATTATNTQTQQQSAAQQAQQAQQQAQAAAQQKQQAAQAAAAQQAQAQAAQTASAQQSQQAAQSQAQQSATQQQAVTATANTAATTQQSSTAASAASATVKVSFYDPAALGSGMGYNGVAANLAKYPKGTHLKITLADGTVLHRVVNDTGSFVASNPNQIDLAWPNASIPSYGVTTASVSVE
ncbi:SLAP domain-containing protein [Schleiferilactobacillus shenzhenensis]|uniref:Uncharacterized protein n=1 Tax=Schleiferilactobacillus shenzhenensis LY-73 TaxID=1231336 RepID=U4TRM1_9LACO|nr:SLAP domain-containing protein [Schleiferilactobacillus shenzhenensis]ERL64152.1 hypothetical protein L248_1594 [Schleiferilactobacillus shenzhenensis LY-73]